MPFASPVIASPSARYGYPRIYAIKDSDGDLRLISMNGDYVDDALAVYAFLEAADALACADEGDRVVRLDFIDPGEQSEDSDLMYAIEDSDGDLRFAEMNGGREDLEDAPAVYAFLEAKHAILFAKPGDRIVMMAVVYPG